MIQQSVSVLPVAEQIYFLLRQLPSSSVWDAGDFTVEQTHNEVVEISTS